MSKNFKNSVAVAIATLLCAGAAVAGTDTASLTVQASVDKACVVGTTTAMNFGSLALLDTAAGKVVTTGNADAVGKFYTACTNGATGVTYSFAGNATEGFELANAASDKIAYTLYSDSDRSAGIIRAATVAGSSFADFAADGADHELTVYGRIDLATNAAKPVGAYNDTVVITVSYE